MTYVIVGNSAASVAAVESIRMYDKTGKIQVISDEPHHVYSRPQITYLLGEKVTVDKMDFRPKDFYEKNSVEAILGKRVEKINFSNKQVVLDDQTELSYDKLLIATGGTPFVPSIKGVKTGNVHTFTKWADVTKIKASIDDKPKPNVVVIGAGMIGLKAVEGFVNIGIKPTVIELAGRVLSLALDETGSKLMGEHLESLGVRTICKNTVGEVLSENNKVKELILQDGSKIPCDILIVAIGVVPNISLVKDSGMRLGRGIVVNEQMESSIDEIYSAGDVAEAYDVLTENKRVLPIWPNAIEQGRVAGANMAGQKAKFKGGFGMNSIEVCGLSTISVGLANVSGEEYESISKFDEKKKTYRKIVMRKDGKIVGASFVKDVEIAGIFKKLIEEERDVLPFKNNLLDDDFGYLSFPEDVRKEKLSI